MNIIIKGKGMKKNLLPLAAALLTGLLFSCDLLNAGLDEVVLDKIDKTVQEANAPLIAVLVDEGGMGTAMPRGTLTGVKLGIPFTLNYAAKTEFPFTGWQAMLGENEEIIALWTPEHPGNSDKIDWEPVNLTGTEIQVTILFDPGPTGVIIIGPSGAALPFVKVEIDEGRQGIASPRGVLPGVKLGLPFSLNYSTYSEYGFLSWEAVLASAPDNPLGPADVEFFPANEMSTTVRVNKNPGEDRIIIRPVGALKPRVVSVTPLIYDGVAYFTRSIRIRFDRALDPASFVFDNGFALEDAQDWRDIYYLEPGSTAADYYDNRVYKNILIESSLSFTQDDGSPTNNWAPFYDPPELSADGTILDIPFRYGPLETVANDGGKFSLSKTGISGQLTANKILTVTLNRDIKDTRGYSLGEAYTFFVEIGAPDMGGRKDGDDEFPYPRLSINENNVIVRALPPSPGHPDGQIDPGARIFSSGKSEHEYMAPKDGTSAGLFPFPAEDPRYHFRYNEDNWIYIAFQPEYMDYPFKGALIYELHNISEVNSDEVINYTAEIAAPVYDPEIIKTLTARLAENTTVFGYAYNPARPVRVVRYRMAHRSGPPETYKSKVMQVKVEGILLDMMDYPYEDPVIDEPLYIYQPNGPSATFDWDHRVMSRLQDSGRRGSGNLEFTVWYLGEDEEEGED
jgi:hypothetical protein